MSSKKAVKAVAAVVTAWALLISVPAAPASAGGHKDRITQTKRDTGWDMP